MIGKVDLVMWAKNGENVLPTVLKRIDEVIPHEVICHKILVDDHSTDRTTKIAKEFNWNVYPNPKTGIPSGANEALKHVDREFFISIEQDVVLAKNWWEKIPSYMGDSMVFCAQGWRIPTNLALLKLEEYTTMRKSAYALRFVSIDNNIFRTKLLRHIGGFPTMCQVCTDTILIKKIQYETPYKWIVDRNVTSLHIRPSIRQEIQHQYTHALLCSGTPYCWNHQYPLRTYIRMLATSPLSALWIAITKREPNIFWAYPALRIIALKACLDKRKSSNVFRKMLEIKGTADKHTFINKAYRIKAFPFSLTFMPILCQ